MPRKGPQKSPKKLTGRPPLKIDPKVVEGMFFAGGTTEEVASYCGVSRDTVERRFADVRAKARAQRKLRLRQLQWRRAEAGSDTMLIWLGKQELGQADRSRVDVRDVSQMTDEELDVERKALGLP